MIRAERTYRPTCLTVTALLWVALTVLLSSGHASAAPDPASQPVPNYPDLRYYTPIDSAPYAQSDPPGVTLPEQPGYWFTTAQGLNCGIWFRGSFGCSGNIPGAPDNVHQVGWITGDTRVHYDWTLATRFPPTQGAVTIPPLSYINVDGTTCGTTVDNSTYCERGPWRLLIAADHTWING